MARTCDVRRRLDALNRKVFRSAISPQRILPALLAAGVILVLIGGFGLTRAERAQAVQANKTESSAQAKDQKKVGKLTLRAVSAETNQSIEGVSIEYWVRMGENVQEATITTGEDGTAVIEWPADATVHVVGLTATMPKLVPIHMRFDDQRQPLKLPEVKELQFETGTTIGGIIQDEAGHPVPGVKVDVHAPATEYEGGNYVFTLGSPTTDAQGRWRLDVAPNNLAGVWGRTSHPHFRSSDVTASRNLDSVVVVKKGLSVTGRVVDGSGKPIKGARAVIGHDIWGANPPTATTNEQGDFTLENCVAGPSIITVQAEGFAPGFRTFGSTNGQLPSISALTSRAWFCASGSLTSVATPWPAHGSSPTHGAATARSPFVPTPMPTAESSGAAPRRMPCFTTCSNKTTCPDAIPH